MKAFKFQITSNGIWEKAIFFSLDKPLEEKNNFIERFFDNNKSEDVAFEIFFKDRDNLLSFLGVRIKKLDLKKKKECVEEIIEQLYLDNSPEQVIAIVQKILNTTITIQNPDFKEVGFEGFWKSRGSCVIKSANIKLSHSNLLKECPQFNKKYDDRLIMMEYAWNETKEIKYPYWLAYSLSTENGYIDKIIYENLL